MVQGRSPEAGEELLTLTKRPYQISNNLEEVGKDVVEDNITREDMKYLWSTEELLGQDKREILVWHHSLNHCPFKYLLRLSKRVVTPINLRSIRTPPPHLCFMHVWKVAI